MTIRQKILLFIMLPIVLAFLVLRLLDYREVHLQADVLAKEGLNARAQALASRVDNLLQQAGTVALTTANVMAVHAHASEAEINALLQRNVAANPLVYGAAIAFEPGVFKGHRLFSPYAFRAGTGVKVMDIAREAYDYNPAGAVGNAAAATADKGRTVVEAAGLQLAKLLQEVSTLPMSTLHVRPVAG